MLRLAALFARCGVDTVRVTGGEPLVRKGVDQLVAGLKAIPGIRKVTMTTNAIQKGLDYVNTHSAEEIAETISPQFKETDTEKIAIIVDRYKEQDTWKENTVFEKKSFELLENILEEAGELDTRVPYEDLVNTKFAKAAAEK